MILYKYSKIKDKSKAVDEIKSSIQRLLNIANKMFDQERRNEDLIDKKVERAKALSYWSGKVQAYEDILYMIGRIL